MIDSDPFVQWIDVPDDRPILPPVDEEVSGLKDFSSLEIPTDFRIDQGRGLLLGPDICHHITSTDISGAISLFSNSGKNTSLLVSDSSSCYASPFPPALSPDTSPASVVSTPFPRTPETDPSLVKFGNFTSVDTLWDILETEEELCSAVHFVDESGNSLEDIPSQIQDVRLEDLACTPQLNPEVSLPSVLTTAPSTPLSDTLMFMISPPLGTSVSHHVEVMPPEQTHFTSLPLASPRISQSLFEFSPANYPQETPLQACSLSPSLSPLTTLSFFSQSPSVSPNPSPLTNCSPLALPPVPPSNNNEAVESTDSPSSSKLTSDKLRTKRYADTLGDDPPPCKISRSSKARNVDEEEWNPGPERVKRPRAVSSSHYNKRITTLVSSYPPDESSECMASPGSGSHPDATQTTCQICGQGFTRTSDYVRHIQNSASHPETRKVWPCPYCDSSLGRKDALGRHIRTLHPGKPVLIFEGIPGSNSPGDRKESSVQRMRHRKMPPRKQLRKASRK